LQGRVQLLEANKDDIAAVGKATKEDRRLASTGSVTGGKQGRYVHTNATDNGM